MNEQIIFFSIFAVVWFMAVIRYFYSRRKPPKKMIAKYGQPLQHFCVLAAWKTLPIRNSRVDVLFYDDFMLICSGKKEFVLKRGFSDYRILSPFLTLRIFIHSIMEISQNGQTLQLCLSRKNEAEICDFLGISIIRN